MHKIWNILKYMSVFIQFHLLFVYLHSFYKMCKNKCWKNSLSVHFFYCHNYLKVFNSFLFERYWSTDLLRYWSTVFPWVRYVHNLSFLFWPLSTYSLWESGVMVAPDHILWHTHKQTQTHTHTHKQTQTHTN